MKNKILAIAGLAISISSASASAALVHQWTFNDGSANDSVRNANATLFNGANVSNGRLLVDGINQFAKSNTLVTTISEKTLVVWVQPANLDQRAGGVLTLESSSGDVFDSIVLAEIQSRVWMPGSDFFTRTNSMVGTLQEDAVAPEEVMIAISYDSSNGITMYRNGELYQQRYVQGSLRTYDAGVSGILFGLRHSWHVNAEGFVSGFDAFFAGGINEARIYDTALTESDIQILFDAGPVPVPLPSALWLLMPAVVGLGAMRRRLL